jgi:hypothetical protein
VFSAATIAMRLIVLGLTSTTARRNKLSGAGDNARRSIDTVQTATAATRTYNTVYQQRQNHCARNTAARLLGLVNHIGKILKSREREEGQQTTKRNAGQRCGFQGGNIRERSHDRNAE